MRVLPLYTISRYYTSAFTAGLCGLIDLLVPPALPHIHKLCVVKVVPLIHLFNLSPLAGAALCATCQSVP